MGQMRPFTTVFRTVFGVFRRVFLVRKGDFALSLQRRACDDARDCVRENVHDYAHVLGSSTGAAAAVHSVFVELVAVAFFL